MGEPRVQRVRAQAPRPQMNIRTGTAFTIANNAIGISHWHAAVHSLPKIFMDFGFEQVTLNPQLRHGNRFRGDILDVFARLNVNTPFRIHQNHRKITEVKTLGQALQTYKNAGVKNLWVQVSRDFDLTTEGITLYALEHPGLIANIVQNKG